jgi:ABC-type dipeptide/oligopeptide/nickel transport system permease subunit
MATIAAEQPVVIRQPSAASRLWTWSKEFTRRKPLSAVAFVVLVVVVLLAVFAPFVTGYDPDIGNIRDRLQAPSRDHPLGTDEQGRDVWTRLVYGARMSLAVGLFATAVGTICGVALGLISGYSGGVVDMGIQRVMDAVMAIPPIILLMVMASVLSPSLRNVVIAVALYVTPGAARVIRGATLTIKEQQFIEAARSMGANPHRVVFRHVLPNTWAPIIVLASITVGGAIIIEAALGFLGLSVALPTATWGNMLNTGAQNFMEQAPWLALAPGIAIALTVFSVNILGDGLRDVLDPRLRGKGK